MGKHSNRDSNTLGYSERVVKENLSKVHFYLLYKNIRPWDTIEPEVMAEWNKTKNDITDWLISERRKEAKKEAKKARKKIRFIEW